MSGGGGDMNEPAIFCMVVEKRERGHSRDHAAVSVEILNEGGR